MDSTLIGNFGQQIVPRPHLQTFLTFCFSNFKSVSIWTAADDVWFHVVNGVLFQPILRKISPSIGKQCHFRFVFTRPKGKIKFILTPENKFKPQPIFVKELQNIFDKPLNFPEFNKHNTLIVDDTPETYACNYHNAIHILPFVFTNSQDRELLKLMFYLKELGEYYTNHRSILAADKKDWFYRDHIVYSVLNLIYDRKKKPVKTI